MDHEANFRKKFANVKPQRVKSDDSFVPRIEEDEMVEHLLAEPKIDDVSVDGVLNFGKDNALKDLGMSEFSCGYDYFLNSYSKGGFDSNIAPEGQDELELGVLDGLLDEVEEVEDVHAADGLASPSEDFLLEIGFVSQASLWEYPPGGGPNSRNTCSERQSPGLSGSSNSAVGISESSSVTIQESECKNTSPKKTTDMESRGTFKHKKRRKKAVESRIRPASNDNLLQDPNDQLEDEEDDDPLLSSMLITKNAKNSGDVKKVGGASRREKRTRRPTQRYIEELSHKKSKKREGNKDKRQKVKSHEELYVTNEDELVSGNKVLQELPEMIRPRRGRPKKIRISISPPRKRDEDEFSSESEDERVGGNKALQEPLEMILPRRGRPKKRVSISPPPRRDEDDFSSESEGERVVKKRSYNNDRRKHQRMWTIAEVSRLIDGISEFGVGRWTEIKRLLFATTAYRTPIDLRDKWRNLLRASSLHKLKMKEAGENQSHPLRPIPKSLIRRVNELAKVHPYPRVRGQKKISRSTRKSDRK